MDQYQPKPKKPYTGPPRPNLMKHEGDLKKINQQVDTIYNELAQTRQENRVLRSKINQLEFEIRSLQFGNRRFR